MLQTIKALLAEHGISLVAPLSLSACTIRKPYLLEREGIEDGTAFLFAVPYYTTKCDDPARNLSVYAVSRDYHGFFGELFGAVLPRLRKAFPENRFCGFSDHSPIAEAEAAVKAGLGVWGCHHLFLTEAHSSFVFLGEIVTDALLDAPGTEPGFCKRCGACRAACPVGLEIDRCLSALTQKRGDLTAEERETILRHGSAWGCDICQLACPYTARAREAGTLYTRIPYFEENAVPHLTAEALAAMPEEEFEKRAYSWRGRAVILRNLELLEKGDVT